MKRWAVKRAASKIKTESSHGITNPLSMATATSRKAVSLVDLPLDILFMILDYVACRDHLPDQHYSIRLKRTYCLDYELVVSQPALLMVSASLRFALSYHFYVSCSFHAKIGIRSLLERAANGLTIQDIDDKLPYPLKLSTIKLDIEIRRVEGGFNPSNLVELGKKIFQGYQAMKLNPADGIKLIDLRWRLVCTDTFFIGRPYNKDVFNHDLQLLLEEIHRTAAISVSLQSYSVQKFGSLLEIWLKEEHDFDDPTYRVRTIFRWVSRSMSSASQQMTSWYHTDLRRR
jgi:hypothetical protein